MKYQRSWITRIRFMMIIAVLIMAVTAIMAVTELQAEASGPGPRALATKSVHHLTLGSSASSANPPTR